MLQFLGIVTLSSNRNRARGGGVGVYLKESVKFKRRKDIEGRYPELEHLWIEMPGRNKNSKLLMARYIAPSQRSFLNWLQDFEELLSDLTVSWDGMLLIPGDVAIDLFKLDKPNTRKYNKLLQSLNLKQMVTKTTRTTKSSATLIDHFITNLPKSVTYTDVLPCPLVSDHDAPYISPLMHESSVMHQDTNISEMKNSFVKRHSSMIFLKPLRRLIPMIKYG